MSVNIFCSSLGNAPLQRQLLAMETPTLESAVQAGNYFAQLRPMGDKVHIPIRSMDEPAELTVVTMASVNPKANSNAILQHLMKELQKMTE